ncbi:cupin domain-containing protein [Paenibacillus pasadenensis]|nr:cupin domain-containing protein [Paenibacillus pasadenensis]
MTEPTRRAMQAEESGAGTAAAAGGKAAEAAVPAGTVVLRESGMEWDRMPHHPELYHREICSAADADRLGIRASSVLWEKIGVGGAVLPHHHDVAELIHITKGQVKLLCNGQWTECRAGDTFQVPAGVVHSVFNAGHEPSEQISVFLPVEPSPPPNRFFGTTLVDVPGPPGAEAAPPRRGEDGA